MMLDRFHELRGCFLSYGIKMMTFATAGLLLTLKERGNAEYPSRVVHKFYYDLDLK